MIENIQLTAALFGGIAYLSMRCKQYDSPFKGRYKAWWCVFNVSAAVLVVASLARIWAV